MIDFRERAELNKKANIVLERILDKDDTLELYKEISEITDIKVAQVVIRKLVEKVQKG